MIVFKVVFLSVNKISYCKYDYALLVYKYISEPPSHFITPKQGSKHHWFHRKSVSLPPTSLNMNCHIILPRYLLEYAIWSIVNHLQYLNKIV